MKLLLKFLLLSHFLFAADNTVLHQFFNKQVCDQILYNDGYFTTCYDYKAKGAKFVAYTLDGSLINKGNIEKRPKFYPDLNIPKRYRSEPKDYTHNLYDQDRGHLAAVPFIFSKYGQEKSPNLYVMSNIIPQASTVNRSKKAWAGAERFARALAVKLGKVNVLNGVIYSNNPKRIGHNQIAVPDAYWKMLYSDDGKYQRCFYFENKQITKQHKKLKDYEVQCINLNIRDE